MENFAAFIYVIFILFGIIGVYYLIKIRKMKISLEKLTEEMKKLSKDTEWLKKQKEIIEKQTIATQDKIESEKKEWREKYKKIWDSNILIHAEKKTLENLTQELTERNQILEEANKKLTAKNEKLWLSGSKMGSEKQQFELLKNKLHEYNKQITDSIQYAKFIQDSILPPKKEIFQILTDSFILFLPKDIVSGDLYWFNASSSNAEKSKTTSIISKYKKLRNNDLLVGENVDNVIIACIDCTGHGVPGAFMSMIGNDLLNNIILEKGFEEPAEILNQMHHGIRFVLRQDKKDALSKDGMDAAVCSIDLRNRKLKFSGARRPLYIINNIKDQFTKAEPSKFSVGGEEYGRNVKFENNYFDISEGDTFYMFTDGFGDQFGGPRNKKYSSKRVTDFLKEVSKLKMKEQLKAFENEHKNWKGNQIQTDDIMVFGMRF